MIEVTSRHLECTHFILDYSRMPAVALHTGLLQLPNDCQQRQEVVL